MTGLIWASACGTISHAYRFPRGKRFPHVSFSCVATPLFVHAWPKLHNGPAAVAVTMAKAGFVPGLFFAYAAIFLETVGATCVILGLFTRFFAAALAIEMACITFGVFLPQGWGRMEPTFIWGILFFAIALRGGGPYSLDRVIGKQL